MTTARKSAVTAIAAAMAAALSTQTSYAAMAGITPTAVWDSGISGQELNTTQGGLTIAGNSGVTVSDKITISSSAEGGAYIVLPSGLSKVSVLIKYSNFAGFTNYSYYSDHPAFAPQFMAVSDNDSHEVGLNALNSATTFQWYHGTSSKTTSAGPAFPAASGYALFAYNNTQGMYLATGKTLTNMTGSEKTGYYFSGAARTLKRLGLGGSPDRDYGAGWPGLVIEKVAIFTDEYYTESDVASYEFPSEIGMYRSDVDVSTINADNPDASEIDVILADGVTVTGDTTFTATKVNFHCEGSFTMTAPEGNTATFDFSRVIGAPILKYTGFFPVVSGTTFTSNSIPTSVSDASSWKGTVWVRGVTQMVNLNPDTYGNGNSTLRLSGCAGHFASGAVTCNVAIELMDDGYQYGINVSDGYSRASNTPNNRVVINKLKGSGAVWTSGGAGTVLINVRDWSEFTGPLQFVNKILILGEDIPAIADFNVSGSIYIGAGATLTATSQLRADGGIYVNGELSTPSVSADYIRAETTIHVPDTGILEITRSDSSANNDGGTAYGNVTGTGTIKFAGEGFTVISQSIPTALTFAAEKANGSVVPAAGATIGSLTGSKGFRSDWGTTGESGRYLTIKQSKDTVWDGSINAGGEHRLTGVVVDPGASSTGTLTMTANQTATSTLAVNGSVNLIGTWVGDVTVEGTLGGTGTITGDLTLSNGATIKVNDISNSLEVSGSLTATGAITIELPEGADKGMVISTGSAPTISGATFTVKVGGVEKKLKVKATADGLKVGIHSLLIRIR